ncbi:unnamed protein product [Durusdinium trenchii]|uniref:Phosphatidylinositol-specific phospholipase C X domain-containing protein n=1 Tax=Durusdinium trenchii TaxID=1381693 RepID=A0ABP0MR68_9DINO
MGNIQRSDYNAQCDIDVQHPNWMKNLSDQCLLGELFIPGTHDSCSLHGGDAIQCQSLPLPKQFRAGIRYLDIRLRHFNDTLPVHHGLKFQHTNFTGVLRSCREFLEEEPSEGILMRVKQEYQAANNTTSFDQLVKGTCLSVLGAKWFVDYKGKLEALTLGQLRGKILILQQYRGEKAPGAFRYGCLDIQDEYSLPTVFHIKSKISQIEDHFKKKRGCVSLNHLSGSGAGCYPYTCARNTNSAALEVLRRNETMQGTIVAADFPGSGLISEIVRRNG